LKAVEAELVEIPRALANAMMSELLPGFIDEEDFSKFRLYTKRCFFLKNNMDLHFVVVIDIQVDVKSGGSRIGNSRRERINRNFTFI
jgi:hypothetical protein